MIVGVIILFVGILAFFASPIIVDRSETKKGRTIGVIILILSLIAIFGGAARLIDTNNKIDKSTFKIIKVDSTHVYKINESGDSLIIENR